MHGYRTRPIIPPTLKDLDLPAHPFNVILPTPVTEKAEEEAENSDDEKDKFSTFGNLSLIDISPISSPSRASFSEDLNTTWISNESFVSYISDGPLPPSPPRQKKNKRKHSIGMSFPKKRGVSQLRKHCEACGQIIVEKGQPK